MLFGLISDCLVLLVSPYLASRCTFTLVGRFVIFLPFFILFVFELLNCLYQLQREARLSLIDFEWKFLAIWANLFISCLLGSILPLLLHGEKVWGMEFLLN